MIIGTSHIFMMFWNSVQHNVQSILRKFRFGLGNTHPKI
ncbi:hypothetical protein C427_2083 [Paraglaciecola psychrophila 170]|uniref:Uncharacterized protein n=1 Tax=Paraglaciecola psychrophila 170 TaxID=1129794 RepID=K6ZWY2_9ALTE|nr:hypothetical protein C427_2083 [Paraglaciecola psychrophila 170]GAC40411.1 hypothetical protein GPSY_4809 [Paraglaciecola psychrophila 170]